MHCFLAEVKGVSVIVFIFFQYVFLVIIRVLSLCMLLNIKFSKLSLS